MSQRAHAKPSPRGESRRGLTARPPTACARALPLPPPRPLPPSLPFRLARKKRKNPRAKVRAFLNHRIIESTINLLVIWALFMEDVRILMLPKQAREISMRAPRMPLHAPRPRRPPHAPRSRVPNGPARA